jgi:hypothetical protein
LNMVRKQMRKDDHRPIEQDGQTADDFVARQGTEEGYEVGYGKPPTKHQFKPGESGNPKGNVKRRTHLWEYFTQYMAMTDARITQLNKAKLTQAQQTALALVEKIKAGEKVGSTALARYIVDREEGKAVEHLVLDNGTDTGHEPTDEEWQRFLAKHKAAEAEQSPVKPV